MPKVAEIYFYVDLTYKGSLKLVVSMLRNQGYRVIVGYDLDELLLLLEVSRPTVLVYNIAQEGRSLSESFQQIANKALENRIPIMLIGPQDPEDGVTLYNPLETSFDHRHIPFHGIVNTIEDLRDDRPFKGALDSLPPDEEDSVKNPSKKRLVDTVTRGSDTVRVQTEIEITGDDKAQIVTTVFRHGEILIREEQSASQTDHALASKMETQHVAAVRCYSPILPSALDHPGDMRDISGPILLPEITEELAVVGKASNTRMKLIVAVSAVGMVISLGVALFLSTLPTLALPIALDHIVPEKAAIAATLTPPAPSKPTENRVSLQPMGTMYNRHKTEDDKGGVEVQVNTEDLPRDVHRPAQMSEAIPFPGRFRPKTTIFWFQDKEEEKRFVSMIMALPEGKKIRLIGHATKAEVKDKKKALGLSRAWSVLRYIQRKGIDSNRIVAVRGKAVLLKSDIDDKGRPLNRFVDVVIEE